MLQFLQKSQLTSGLFRNVKVEDLHQWIGDELRVHLTHQALVGQPPVMFGSQDDLRIPPASLFSPWDFYTFYQEQCSKHNIAMIPIPVKPESFDAKSVSAVTKEEQMNSPSNQFSNDVPKPNSPTPGFKAPQRMSVQWLPLAATIRFTVRRPGDCCPFIRRGSF